MNFDYSSKFFEILIINILFILFIFLFNIIVLLNLLLFNVLFFYF